MVFQVPCMFVVFGVVCKQAWLVQLWASQVPCMFVVFEVVAYMLEVFEVLCMLVGVEVAYKLVWTGCKSVWVGWPVGYKQAWMEYKQV